jgi:putative peptide zinc metalloprotease protein
VGRVTEKVWRAAADRPRRRRAARVTAVAIVAVLVYSWWPTNANYAPVQAYEPGTLGDVLAPVSGSSRPTGVTQTLWPQADANTLPTRAHPVLAVVMRPVDDDDAQTWVFPFNRPLPPGDGDNQAFALNTTDGTVVYDVSFALVWARDGSVLNRNEAYAFASCEDCAAVAIGFQVVMAIGKVDVAVPENLAGAINYACVSCVSCVTYALASQLVVTLPGELSPSAMEELTALWEEIRAYGEHIPQAALADLQSDLEQFKRRIREVIERDTGESLTATTTTVAAATAASTADVPTTTVSSPRATAALQVTTTHAAAAEPRPTTTATATTAEATTSTSDPTTTTTTSAAENPTP